MKFYGKQDKTFLSNFVEESFLIQVTDFLVINFQSWVKVLDEKSIQGWPSVEKGKASWVQALSKRG